MQSPPKAGLWPHEKALLESGALTEISHKGASSVLLQAPQLGEQAPEAELEAFENMAQEDEARKAVESEEMVSIYRHMTDKECSYLRERGRLPDSQPYQTIVEGTEGFEYCKKYFCGKKKVTPPVSTIVEFMCPRSLVDRLFAMQLWFEFSL